jgi:hypothetical protein
VGSHYIGCGRSPLVGGKQPRLLHALTAATMLHGSLHDRLRPQNPVDKLIPVSSVQARALEVTSSCPLLTRCHRADTYGVSKLSTTPARDVDDEGGETACTPMPRLAKPAQTSGRSSGLSADTAVMIASRAWV